MQWRTTNSEYELLDAAVDELSRTRAFPLVFGGLAAADGVHISSLRGNRTAYLAGLHVQLRRGLGGRSMSEQRARITSDYRLSRVITHDYDRQVLGEQVRTLLAIPVIVDGRVRGMLYGGERGDHSVGTVAVEPAVAIAKRLQTALGERDRAEQRRLQALQAPVAAPSAMAPERLEELRSSHAELRAIMASVSDPELAERLRGLEQRLLGVTRVDGDDDLDQVRLSPRELDVLGFAGLGLRNAEIGRELGLTESTVKSYMGSVLQKLGQRSRHAAVAEARRQGILP